MIIKEQSNTPNIHDLLDVSSDRPQVNCIFGASGVGISTMLQGITGELIGPPMTPRCEKQYKKTALKQDPSQPVYVDETTSRYVSGKTVLICDSSQPLWTFEKISRYIAGRLAPESQTEFEAPEAGEPSVHSAADHVNNHLVLLNGVESKTSIWDSAGANHDRVLRARISDGDVVRGVVIDDLDTIILGIDTNGCDKPYRAHARHLRDYLAWARKIANEFCCPVWIGHHLKAAAASSDPKQLLSHTDAALWKDMGNQIDRCFVMGNHDGVGRFRFDRTKPRGSTAAPQVIRNAGGIWFNNVAPETYREFFEGPIYLDQVHVDPETLAAMHEVAEQIRISEYERSLKPNRVIELD